MGVRARRVENYYTDLLASETISENNVENPSLQSDSCSNGSSADSVCITEKWKGQIEKVFALSSVPFSVCLSFSSFSLFKNPAHLLNAGFASYFSWSSCFGCGW